MLTFELPIALPDHAAVLVSAVPYLGTIVFPAITADDLCREWTQAVMVPPFGFTDCHLRLHLFPLVRINDRRVALLRQVLCDPVERLALHDVTFSEMERLSSWARLLMMVNNNSPRPSKVQMASFSKKTSTPCSFNSRMVERLSTVFRAKRLTLFVTIRLIFPASASSIIRLKPSLCFVFKVLIPSSVYTSTNSQSGFERMKRV